MTHAGAPADDLTISGDTELWRRIHPDFMTIDDSVEGGRRPSSGNFDENEMSAVIANECTGGLATLLRGHDGFGVAGFTVGAIRALGWGVVRAEQVDLPGHVVITGNTGKKNHKNRTTLARSCRIILEPRFRP